MRKYWVIARINLQNAFTYRSQIISRMGFYVLFIFVFFSLWRAIYQGGEVAGYTQGQVVWYLIITELIAFACRSDVFGQMNEDVKTGAIAYQLNRPVRYIGYQLASSLGVMVVNTLFFGVLAVALGMIFAGPIPNFNWQALPLMALSGILGVLLQFFCQMTLGLTAFRLEDNSALFLIYQKLVFMLGVFLPVEFLPSWLQPIARALPFSYVAWAPARLTVSFTWELFYQVLPMQLAWTLAALGLSVLVYRNGIKGLQANGG